MQRNNKLAILIILMAVVIFVWIPKGKKTKDVSLSASLITSEQAIPMIKTVLRKRTEFVDWGRNPFSFSQIEKVGDISNLKLSCIMWNAENAQAFINQSLVRVGDEITDKTVKQIEQDRVILTDGTKDYVLKLQE